MPKGKLFWFDTETTGLIPGDAGIHHLAALIEIDGRVVEELDLRIQPLLKHSIDPYSLKVSGVTKKQVSEYPPATEQFNLLKATLEKYVSRYKREDKFILAGYNISYFDEPFLRAFFSEHAATKKERETGNYFGSYFAWPKRDVQTYVAEHFAELSLRTKDFKLETLCDHFNIPIEAHNALSDIRATRTLYHVLRYSFAMAPAA